MEPLLRVLLVDDAEENLMSLAAMLGSPEYLLVSARSGAEALELARQEDFAVILLDVLMPGLGGLETARRLKSAERSRNTPIILVTGAPPEEATLREGYEAGAVDFVCKPFDPRVLRCKVAVFAELFRKTLRIHEQDKLLREASELRFKTLFEQAPVGVVIYSTEGRVLRANRAWDELWGVEAARLREVNALAEPDRVPCGEAIRRALEGEASELPTAAFGGKWIRCFAYPVRDERGVVREAAVITQDVSLQRGVEEELKRSRDQLRIIIDSVADGIVVHDRDERCVYANDIGAQLLGFADARELIGNSAFPNIKSRFLILDLRGQPVDASQISTSRALRGEHPEPRGMFKVKDLLARAERWLEVSSRPVLDDGGKPHLAVTIYRDITAKQRLEEGDRFLSEATAILAASLDYRANLGEICELAIGTFADWCKIALVDEHGVLRTVAVRHSDPKLAPIGTGAMESYALNPAADAGSPAVLRTGKSIINSDVGEQSLRDVSVNAEHLDRLRALGLRSVMIVPIRIRERILGTIGLAYSGTGRNYDGMDLTMAEELGRRAGMAIDNALLYQEAQSQRARLQDSVRAREEFISIAGHELKTPVTSLILHAEMAALWLQRGDPPEELRERLQKFVMVSISQIDRLSRLIDDLLDVSRIISGRLSMERERLDLVQLAGSVLDDFSGQLAESRSPARLEGRGPVWVNCDRYRIEQVVTNLLTNAMKYGEGRPIEVTVAEAGAWAELAVRDQGRGIAPEHQSRIFERFERAETGAAKAGGLGLGLYIVRNIVESHGGTVSVRSAPGEGAEFLVRLPL